MKTYFFALSILLASCGVENTPTSSASSNINVSDKCQVSVDYKWWSGHTSTWGTKDPNETLLFERGHLLAQNKDQAEFDIVVDITRKDLNTNALKDLFSNVNRVTSADYGMDMKIYSLKGGERTLVHVDMFSIHSTGSRDFDEDLHDNIPTCKHLKSGSKNVGNDSDEDSILNPDNF